MKINHNIAALRTITQLNRASNSSSKAMERLSSGLKINSAADDAAGLAISQKMDTQVRGLQQANRNAMDGISMIQTAEGAYNEVHSMLQRMRELAVKAGNSTYDPKDKATIMEEVSQLQEELVSVQQRTEFNKKALLDGSQNKVMLQVGANKNQSIQMSGSDMNLDSVLGSIYGIGTGTSDIILGELPNGTTISVNGTITTIGPGTSEVTSLKVPADTLVIIELPATLGTTINGVTVQKGEKISFKTGEDVVTFNDTTAGIKMTTLKQGSGASAILSDSDVNKFEVGTGMTIGALPVGAIITVNGKETTLGLNTSIDVLKGGIVSIRIPKDALPPLNINIIRETGSGTPITSILKNGEEIILELGSIGRTFETNVPVVFAASDLDASETKAILPNTNNTSLLDLSDKTGADDALDKIEQAIGEASRIRARLGAYQNRLEHTVSSLGVNEENMTASFSRIQDADMATEMSSYTQQNILVQAATAMLAQANQRPEQILQLLQK